MEWAQSPDAGSLGLIHIRDWHDATDPMERRHLEIFGPHCLRDSEGARFVFAEQSVERAPIVNSIALNDFVGTTLADTLTPYEGAPVRTGIVGVWTEAKVSFLAYDLTTRYPQMQLAVCSALTASSSRQRHFAALDQLARILDLRVIDSVGEFIDFLGGDRSAGALRRSVAAFPKVELAGGCLAPTDADLAGYLFRDCGAVELKPLAGGFSGNIVAAAKSRDLHGHEQVPHVLKIGPRDAIGRERASFERVQDVLGNNAPAIVDFADFGDRGALKYRYASMGGASVTTLQKQYEAGLSLDEFQRVLDTVFNEQLGRFTRAAQLESDDLLAHYGFSPKWAPHVREKVEQVLGRAAGSSQLEITPGVVTPNPCAFYEQILPRLAPRPRDEFYMAWAHGDLNGANIVRDANGNVWLIDFFHTRRAHVLTDLIKLENDLLYIWTKLSGEAELVAACRLLDRLMQVEDLGVPLPALDFDTEGTWRPEFKRCWSALQVLRSFYPQLVQSDRSPFQLHVGQLRYAVHTLGFDECSPLQKRFALYASGQLADRVARELLGSTALRLDWLEPELTAPGRLALTLLPGRRDRGRALTDDLETIVKNGVTHVLSLVPADELAHYGVPELLRAYSERGLTVHSLPIPDQKVCDLAAMQAAVAFLEDALKAGRSAVAHCVGGLGRTGLAAACLLRGRGLSAEQALAAVRRARSPRAVENALQEQFVAEYR
jgi:protein-tyrosine phosphatase